MKLLHGKTAIITGAGRGIGKAIAQVFAEQGANLALTDIVISEEAEKFAEEISKFGVKVKFYKSDVSNYDDCHKTVDDILKDFETVDILVNNAGITRDTLLMRMSEEQWDAVINVNLKSAFNMTKAVQKIMLKKRKGSIINMSSVVGVSGNAGQANYSASKAGMIGFTKSIAKELGGRKIRCNAIAPGFIETEMTAKLSEDMKKEWLKFIPLKRAGTPEDVANLAVFLGSDMSSYISGQVITVCGAMNT